MPRSVLYIDPPAFCTTVEALVAPALRGRPVAVAAAGADRATILALSPEARAAGLERGMAVRLARKRCPDLELLPPNPRLYARASRALHEVLQRYAPVIEPHGYGHAFLDLTGTTRLFGPAVDVAARITREVGERFGLPLTVGVAVNKLVSEAATRVGRLALVAPLIEVARGDEAGFLAPQALGVLPDLPADIRERLDEYHLRRIGEVAAIREADLCAVFGRRGGILRQQARGVDPRPVLPPEVRAEFRTAHTLATDTNDRAVLHQVLRHLAERLGARLRRRGLAARRLTVTVDHSDHTGAHHAQPLAASALDLELWSAARRGLERALARRVAVRTVTLTVDHLVEANLQLDLWAPPPGRAAVIQQAVDATKGTDRFGDLRRSGSGQRELSSSLSVRGPEYGERELSGSLSMRGPEPGERELPRRVVPSHQARNRAATGTPAGPAYHSRGLP